MNEEFEDIFHDEEYSALINRYEKMLENNTKYFFDVVEFESIIDYYIDSDKSNNALSVIEFASQQHPYSINIQLKKAQVLINKGNGETALRILEKIEKIETSNADVFLIKGSALNVVGRFGEAEKSFDTAIKYAYDDKISIIHMIAQSFEQIGRYKFALKYLLQAYELDDKSIMLLYDIGYCYEKLGQINKSIEYYVKYLDKEPFSENAWYNVGVLYNKVDNYNKAIDAYEYALAVNPEFSVAYFNLANAYLNKDDFHKAILNYKEYINFDGNSVEILTYIGDCYDGLKEFDLALKYYDEALNLDDHFADTFFGKANVLFRMGKTDLALSFIEKAISIDDTNAEYYYLLGNIHNNLKHPVQALEAFKKTISLQPEELDFILSLAEAHVNAEEHDIAIEILTGAIKNHTSELLHYRLAGCYFLIKNDKKALEAFENGLKINSRSYLEITSFYPEAVDNNEINVLLNKYYSNK